MNRRSFISGILTAAVAPMFLKGAARQWKKSGGLIWVPQGLWMTADYQVRFIVEAGFYQNLEHALHAPCKSYQEFQDTLDRLRNKNDIHPA